MRSTKQGKLYRDSRADPWKHDVRAACKLALLQGEIKGLVPLGIPLGVEMIFRFARPKAHYRTGKFAAELKPSAPTFHTAKPDADNLSKAVLDAVGPFDKLPCLVWCDDAQVAWAPPCKLYADPGQEPGASIVIFLLERDPTTMTQLYTVDDLTYGEALEVARRRAGATQVELAGIFGVRPCLYRKWELDVDTVELVPSVTLGRLEPYEECMIARRRAGVDLHTLSRASGLSRQWISLAERGRVRNVDVLVELWRRMKKGMTL